MAHNNLGGVLERIGELEEAEVHYTRAINIDPENALAHNNLGNLLQGRGEIDAAIAHHRRAIAIQPDYARAHTDLGAALERSREYDQAMTHYQRSLQLIPDFWPAHRALGILRERQGDAAQAIWHYRSVLAVSGNDSFVQNRLAWILATDPNESLRNGVEALRMATEAARDREVSNLMTLAAARAEVGQFEEAVRIAKDALILSRDTTQDRWLPLLNEQLQLYRDRKPYRTRRDPRR